MLVCSQTPVNVAQDAGRAKVEYICAFEIRRAEAPFFCISCIFVSKVTDPMTDTKPKPNPKPKPQRKIHIETKFWGFTNYEYILNILLRVTASSLTYF